MALAGSPTELLDILDALRLVTPQDKLDDAVAQARERIEEFRAAGWSDLAIGALIPFFRSGLTHLDMVSCAGAILIAQGITCPVV